MPQPTLPESPNPDPRSLQADAAWRRFRRSGDAAAIADLFDLAAGDLHRTALHLVGDDATAHDLVQTTFLAALEQRTFDDARAVLPWLFGILRNQAALVHRRRARAFDRERIGERIGEAVADPAVQAADRETLTAVEGALAQLPDALQPVVRLHLLHGVDAAAIARSLQRPGGTVRTQLVRGLAKLRALLPVGLGGLLAGLLPSAGRAAVRTAVLAAAQHAPVTAVQAAWWARPRSALLAALGAAVVALAVLFARGDRAPAPAPAPAGSVASTAPAAAAPAQGAADTATPAPSPAARTEVAAAPAAAFEVRGTVHGTVRGQDGMPVEGAEVLLWCTRERPAARGRAFEPPAADVATTAADGTFAVRGRGASCYLLARTADAISVYAIAGELDGRDRVDGLELQLGPTVLQRGRLVDPDGRGVAGFSFGTHRGSSRSAADRLAVVGFSRCELPDLDVRTDADGAFAIEAARDYFYVWEVQHPDHPMLRVRHRPADGDVELRLERGATITGTVWQPNGDAAQGAEVVLHDYPPRRGSCDASGAFALHGAWLREGLWLHVDAADAAICCVPVANGEPLRVRLEPARVLAGRVVDQDGKPVADAEVHIVGDRTIFTGATYTEPSTWEFVCGSNLATTAADGAFRFERLYDGVFAVELREPGAVDFTEVTKARSGTDQLVLRAGRAAALRATIRGQLRDALTNAPIERAQATVWRPGEKDGDWHGRLRELDAPGGAYAMDGLAAGLLRFSFHARGYALAEVLPREFAAGAHTVDVPMYPARSVAVEVRAGGAPASGDVRVHLGDGRWLMLEMGAGSADNTMRLDHGKARLDGLPARAVTIVVERRGQPPVAQVVDLTQPRDTPVVFDVDALDPVPQVRFGVVVMLAARDADAATWQGPVDRAWWLRAQQNAALSPPDREVKLTVETADGKVVARATIAPGKPDGAAGGPTFHCNVQQVDGTGLETEQSPVSAVSFHLRRQPMVVRAEAEGRAAVVRRVEPAELAGDEPGFAIVLRPQ